jgi:hypothetical protein
MPIRKKLIKKKKFKDSQVKFPKIKRKTRIKRSKKISRKDGLIKKEQTINRRDIPRTSTTVDHNFLFDEPSQLAEVEKKIIGSNASVFYIEPMFNYLATEWERFFETRDELAKPNMYIETDYSSDNDRFKNFRINRNTVKIFNNIEKSYIIPTANTIKSERNVLFSKGYEYKKSNYYKKDYPFYVELAIRNKTNTEFKDKLVELGIFEAFIEDYISSNKQSVTFNNTEQVPAFNMATWINGSDLSSESDSIVVLKNEEEEINNFTYNLKKIHFAGFMRKQIDKHMRTYNEISQNKLAYSEELFYKIDKYNDLSDELIQSFWIPADKRIEIIDTQVNYGIEYRYECKVYYLVVGSVYSITRQKTQSKMTIEPSVQVLELPYFEDTCRVIQPPQPVPDVIFNNNGLERGDIKVNVKLNANSYSKNFIPLEATELAQNELVESYNKLKRKNYFQYETEHALFEVFKLPHIPKTYDEIDQYKIAEIRHSEPSIGALFRDTIGINNENYYVFRSINYHDLLSNPTPIYKVHLTADANDTFLHVETVGLFEKNNFISSLKFSNRIQIIPSSLHTILDQDLEKVLEPSVKGKIDKVQLGVASKPIWGKKFKFRFTSTDTGKKIDINVNVKLTKDKTLEDFK